MNMLWRNAIAATIVLHAVPALAGLAPDLKCQATKNKLTGAYYACRQKAEATAVSKGGPADYTKCVSKFAEKWSKAETTSGGMCPDNVAIISEVETLIAGHASTAAAVVAGTNVTSSCGDGAINVAGEHCDGAALGGNTCETFGLYGALSCTAGCEFDLGACTACPGSSFPYEGTCWVLGALGASCDAACGTVGLAYDDATTTVAGSSGTNEDCTALLYALDATGGELEHVGDCAGLAFGCTVYEEFGFRARCLTPATTSTGGDIRYKRVCACEHL
jgi:hypothetical protein